MFSLWLPSDSDYAKKEKKSASIQCTVKRLWEKILNALIRVPSTQAGLPFLLLLLLLPLPGWFGVGHLEPLAVEGVDEPIREF